MQAAKAAAITLLTQGVYTHQMSESGIGDGLLIALAHD
jgi:hypothetical protein